VSDDQKRQRKNIIYRIIENKKLAKFSTTLDTVTASIPEVEINVNFSDVDNRNLYINLAHRMDLFTGIIHHTGNMIVTNNRIIYNNFDEIKVCRYW
jgi:hypothetical protein